MSPSDTVEGGNRRKLKRKIVLLAFILLVGTALGYDWVKSRDLEQAVREARSGGRPFTFEEIERARTPWPENENGAIVLLGIKDQLEVMEEAKAFDRLPWLGDAPIRPLGERWSTNERTEVEGFLQSRAKELEQVDRFRDFRGGRLPFDTRRTFLTDYKIGFTRSAVKIKSLQVMDRAMNRNTAALVDDLGIMLNMNRVLAEEPLLIGSLVRISCDGLTVATLEQVCALNILQAEHLPAIDGLLAGVEDGKRLYWGMLGERACFLPTCDYALHQSTSVMIQSHVPGQHGHLLEDQAVGLRLWSRQIDAASDPDQSLDVAEEVANRIEQMPDSYLLTKTLAPSLTRCHELNTRLTAQVRAARAAMAVERFRLDHTQFPTTLDQLVSTYMEKVPIDPFDRQPMRYRTTGDRVVIYSVGDDLKDDGGDVGPNDPQGSERRKDWGFVLLSPELRGRTPTTTEPANR